MLLTRMKGPRRRRLQRAGGLHLRLGLLPGLGLLAALALAAPAAQAADDCPNAEFRVGPSALLPDCRAYEMVTPPDKDGYGLVQDLLSGSGAYPAVSGDQAYFAVLTPFNNPQNGNLGQHVAVRTPAGWTSRNFMPPYCREDQSGIVNTMYPAGWSEDLSTMILNDPANSNCAADDHAGQDLYRVDADGALTWLSHNGSPKLVDEFASLDGLSADASHVVFRTREKLILPLDSSRESGWGLYDRTGGVTLPVAVADDGSLLNNCGAIIAGDTSSQVPGRVSADGRVIFFHTGSSSSVDGCPSPSDDDGQLYARIDHERTLMLSESRRTVADTRLEPVFMGASRDGSRAYFRSAEMLTDDATSGGGLYMYDLSAVLAGGVSEGTLHFLTPALNGTTAGVQGRMILGEADDGSTVYFIATGTLAPDAPAHLDPKLYVWRSGEGVKYIAPWTGSTFNPIVDGSVSPDGSKAAFLHRPVGSSFAQAYLYDGEDLVCASCAAGVTPTANVRFHGPSADDRPARWEPAKYVTNDGRVFFNSPDRLVARDTNSRFDVYEYHDGGHKLLSAGSGSHHSLLIGMTSEGRDVFFVTTDALHGSDFDNGDQDIYVARIGGGFPAPAEQGEPCQGEGCQGPISPPLPGPGIGSANIAGDGNAVTPPRRQRLALRVAGAKTVRGSVARLRVHTPAAGRLRLVGRHVRKVARPVARRGVHRLPVVLRPAVRKLLIKRKQLRVNLRVAYRARGGQTVSRRVSIIFRQPTVRRAGMNRGVR